MPLDVGASAPSIDGAPSGPHAVVFYKVTCPTCQMAAPKLAFLERAYPGRVLAVGQDPPERLAAFGREYAFEVPAVPDLEPYPISDAWQIRTVPTVFVVDDGGSVADVVEAWDRDGLNRLSAELAGLLGASAIPVSTPDDGLPAFRPG